MEQPSSGLPIRPQMIDVPARSGGGYPPGDAGYAGYGSDYAEEPGGGGLIEYWRILRRRKGTVLLIAFFGVLLSVLVTLPQTPVYQARTSLEIQDLNEDFMNMKQMTPVSDSNNYNALSDIQTQIKILQSDTLSERTAAKLKMTTAADLKPQPSRIEAWRSALNLPEPKPVDARDELLKAAKKSLKVRAAGQTRIIEVLVDSTNPKVATDFANTIANEFIDQNMEARWQMSQRTADWLGRQLDEMRIKLERSDDALQAYARQTGLLFTGDKQSVSEEKLKQLQEELSKAQADRVAKQSAYEMASSSSPDALPDVLNDTNLRELQLKVTELRQQEAELAATYKPEYIKVRRVHAQVVTLVSALDRERKAIVARIGNDYNEAKRREKLLAMDYANQARLVTQESEKAIQYNILKREVDTNRQLYEAMLQRVKESSIAAAMKASNVRVVDAAQVPRKPYKPSLPLNAGLGLMAGGFLGIAFVVMRERADRSLQEPGDTAFYLNVPELGVIPSARSGGRHRSYYSYRHHKDVAAEPAGLLATGADGKAQTEHVELVTWQHKPSLLAEAFRVVITSILFSGENGNRPRSLVLTSAGPGEGKTTVVTNLAIALAEIRKKVLLIDGDLRKPRVHQLFDLDNERGLTTLLGMKEVDEGLVKELVRETSIPGLHVMTSGPSSAAAANLFFAGNMAELMARFRKEYDMVLVDTPPMLQMPDARVLGRMADAVVLVMRAGHTTRDAAVAARQRFAEDQTKVLGTILNDWDPKSSPNGYYGYYKGYYYYKGYSHHYYNDGEKGA